MTVDAGRRVLSGLVFALVLVCAGLVVAPAAGSGRGPAADRGGGPAAGSGTGPATTGGHPGSMAAVLPVPHATASPWSLVLRPYEAPSHRYGPGHRGIDLVAEPGTAVVAPREGVVSFTGEVAGTPMVVVDHGDGTRSTLLPVTPGVEVGQAVSRAGPLGRLAEAGLGGSSGGTGSQWRGPAPAGHCPQTCLHWGVRTSDPRDADGYLDPLRLLRWHVVLLPPPQ